MTPAMAPVPGIDAGGPADQTAGERLVAIEARIEEIAAAHREQPGPTAPAAGPDAVAEVRRLLEIGEEILSIWIMTRGDVPTDQTREGFLLLALHRQGARGEPSFNACRETCRELVYHHNLILADPSHPETGRRLALAVMLLRHLCLFVAGKIEIAGLGAFCCAARPVRAADPG
jgi:hypothetical protein